MEHQLLIGKFTLESLTSGLYVSPLDLYREYVQNAADSIDEALEQGILKKGEEKISITVSESERIIKISDNGTGVGANDIYSNLIDIGNSKKRHSNSRGFTRRDDYEKNSAYKELLSQFTEWANEMSRQIRHRSYERSLTQSDKKFLSDESVTDVDGVDISLGTELDSYDMDDSDSVANTDLLSKLSLLMDMGKKKTKYNVLNLNSKFTVDQKQTLEHVFDALYAKYTNAKANDIIQTIIDSF